MMEASHTVKEFHKYIGWGHAHWGQGLQLAELVGLRRFLPTHFNPICSHAEIGEWEETVKKHAEIVKVDFSHEGVILGVG